MREILTHQEMLSIAALNPATASELISAALICPISRGTGGRLPGGTRNPARWTVTQVLGICVARGLRSMTIPADQAWAIARLIGATSTQELEGLFTKGRTHLGIVPGVYVHPSLVTKEEALGNEELTKASLAKVGLPPVAFDMARLWSNLKAVVAKIDAGQPPDSAHRTGKINCSARGTIPTANLEPA